MSTFERRRGSGSWTDLGRGTQALWLSLALALTGCARSGAQRPEPRDLPAPAGSPSRGTTQPEETANGAENEPGTPRVLDPTEEITPEELSTIPEPVPATSRGGGGESTRSPRSAAQTAPESDPKRAESDPPPGTSLWRVQIFATQDRDLADRMARGAAERLHVRAHVAYEWPHYKVRLGDYASEEEAGPLRERALRAGFPGAFRIRCASDTTYSWD